MQLATLEEWQQRVLQMPDEQLLDMIMLHRAAYRQSTIELAARELARRGVPYDVPLLAPQPQPDLDSQAWPAWGAQATRLLNHPLAKFFIGAIVLILSIWISYTLETAQRGGVSKLLDLLIRVGWAWGGVYLTVVGLLYAIEYLLKRLRGSP